MKNGRGVTYIEKTCFNYFCRALVGFVSRQEAEEYLHKSENETFLVRFSDSELGGVTVAWITGNKQRDL